MEPMGGTSNIAELPYNNVPLNIVEPGNTVIENKIQNEINNREQLINNSESQATNNQNEQTNYNTMINDLQKS